MQMPLNHEILVVLLLKSSGESKPLAVAIQALHAPCFLQALAGLMLAGARAVSRDRGVTWALRFEPPQSLGSHYQAALMQHLKSLFRPWWPSGGAPASTRGEGDEFPRCVAEGGGVPCPEEGGEGECGVLETVSDRAFRFYAQQYCPGGTHRVPRLVHRWLTPRALAHWYAYGGRRCEETGGMILQGNSFSVSEVRALARAAGVQETECARKVLASGDVEVRFEGASALSAWGRMESHVPQALREALRPALAGTGGPAASACGGGGSTAGVAAAINYGLV